ncbi:MAG TPA: NlpC/P60 family protein [Jatrophihabitans sp.]|nr:NlpC/P60 family protein [Jatrophihabitans sp.]
MIGSVVVLGAVLAAPLAAHALPHSAEPAAAAKPLTKAQVNAKLHSLARSSEQLSEQLNQAKIDITKAQAQVVTATRAADLAQQQLRTAQQQLAISLASQYKSASFSRTVALLSSNSTENYLQTVQTMNLLTEHQSEVATMAANAIGTANAATARAKAAVTAANQKQAQLTKRQQALKAEVGKYQALLATLTAAERVRYFNPTPPPSPAVVNQVFSNNAGSGSGTGSGSGNANTAVQTARAQLGKPYSWGAAGPDSFDCSGLTMYAWGHAGVSLPHNAADQQGMGTSVSQSDLQPGDLVFFGSPAYHVAIYIGDGMIIHAPTSGDVVKIVSLSSMPDYSGARRVG